MPKPLKPLYNGGIIQNPELNDGLHGWEAFGNAKIQHRESLGNKYVVAHNRDHPFDSVSQKIYLRKGLHYSLSGKLYTQILNSAVPSVTISILCLGTYSIIKISSFYFVLVPYKFLY